MHLQACLKCFSGFCVKLQQITAKVLFYWVVWIAIYANWLTIFASPGFRSLDLRMGFHSNYTGLGLSFHGQSKLIHQVEMPSCSLVLFYFLSNTQFKEMVFGSYLEDKIPNLYLLLNQVFEPSILFRPWHLPPLFECNLLDL